MSTKRTKLIEHNKIIVSGLWKSKITNKTKQKETGEKKEKVFSLGSIMSFLELKFPTHFIRVFRAHRAMFDPIGLRCIHLSFLRHSIGISCCFYILLKKAFVEKLLPGYNFFQEFNIMLVQSKFMTRPFKTSLSFYKSPPKM